VQRVANGRGRCNPPDKDGSDVAQRSLSRLTAYDLVFGIWLLRCVNSYGEWSSGSRPEAKRVTCATLLGIDPTRCEQAVTSLQWPA